MRNWLIGLGCAALLGIGSASAQEVLRVGTEGSFPPWNMTTANGELEGLEIDLANALCRELSVRCEFIAYDWEGIFPALYAGQFDAVMSGVAVTEERKKTVALTRTYADTPLSFIARRGSPLLALESLQAVEGGLRGKRIGVQIASTSSKFVQQRLGATSEVLTYRNYEEIQLDLESGRLDAAFGRMLTWSEFMNTPAGRDFALFGPRLTGKDFAGFGEGAAIALPLGSAWEPRLNEALRAVRENGTLRDLHLKWFRTDVYLP